MKGYAEAEVFSKDEIEAYRRAQALVKLLRGKLTEEERASVRCHELARAVGQVLDLPAQDGRYGLVDHSWLWVGCRPGQWSTHVLEVYAVGRLPMVQLVDACAMALPEYSGYQPLPLEALQLRRPIDTALVSKLIQVMLTNSPEWLGVIAAVRGRRPALADCLERLLVARFDEEEVYLVVPHPELIGIVMDPMQKSVLAEVLHTHFRRAPRIEFGHVPARPATSADPGLVEALVDRAVRHDDDVIGQVLTVGSGAHAINVDSGSLTEAIERRVSRQSGET